MLTELKSDMERWGRYSAKSWLKAAIRISFHVIACYRLSRKLRGGKIGRAASRLIDNYARTISGCYISQFSNIAGGLHLPHPTGIVIGEGVTIGRRATIYQHVTLGSGDTGLSAYPTVGDDVTIFANAVVIGAIKIGDGAKIGAGAIVLRDVPPGAVAVGNPARIIPSGAQSPEIR